MDCLLTRGQIEDYIQKYGSPLYIFHAQKFIEDYRKLQNAMRAIYPNYKIAYSYKTNYAPQICKLVKELGGLAEVVSDMEYKLAKKIGYSSEQIIYNGPIKGHGLFDHLSNGGTINIDNLDELRDVVLFASENPKRNVHVAFRVNIDIGQGFISRFGLDAYENEEEDRDSELNRAFFMTKQIGNVHVVGLHCHIGKSRSIEAWEKRVGIMIKLVDRYFDAPPKFIDFGSGMNSIMEEELACQFGEDIPTFEEYAAVIGGAMKRRFGDLPKEQQPDLYTEPGTTLVSGSVSFLTTVKSIKKVKGKYYVTFDCSSGNLGDICHIKKLPISVYHINATAILLAKATFVGYTCLEHDYIYEGYDGELSVGDVVQFRNIGSYSNVFKPPFILPNCAMIQISESGMGSLIKRKETFEDIFQTYFFE